MAKFSKIEREQARRLDMRLISLEIADKEGASLMKVKGMITKKLADQFYRLAHRARKTTG